MEMSYVTFVQFFRERSHKTVWTGLDFTSLQYCHIIHVHNYWLSYTTGLQFCHNVEVKFYLMGKHMIHYLLQLISIQELLLVPVVTSCTATAGNGK